MAAVQASPTDEAISALRRALDRSRLRVRLAGVGIRVPSRGRDRLQPGRPRGSSRARRAASRPSSTPRRATCSSGSTPGLGGNRRLEPGRELAIARGCAISRRPERTSACSRRRTSAGPLQLRVQPRRIRPLLPGARPRGPLRSEQRCAADPRGARYGRCPPRQLSLSPDGRRLAVAGFSRGSRCSTRRPVTCSRPLNANGACSGSLSTPRERKWRPPSPPSSFNGGRSRSPSVTA